MALSHTIFDEVDDLIDGLTTAQKAEFEADFIREFGEDYNIDGSPGKLAKWILRKLRDYYFS